MENGFALVSGIDCGGAGCGAMLFNGPCDDFANGFALVSGPCADFGGAGCGAMLFSGPCDDFAKGFALVSGIDCGGAGCGAMLFSGPCDDLANGFALVSGIDFGGAGCGAMLFSGPADFAFGFALLSGPSDFAGGLALLRGVQPLLAGGGVLFRGPSDLAGGLALFNGAADLANGFALVSGLLMRGMGFSSDFLNERARGNYTGGLSGAQCSRSKMSRSRLDVTVRAWLAEARGRGLSETEILAALPYRDVSKRAARKALQALAASRDADVLATLAFRLARLEWQAKNRHFYAALDPKRRGVPKVARVTKREFLERFYAPQQPVLISGMMRDWKALKKWTPDHLRERYGDVPVQVASGRDDTAFYDLNVHAISRQVRFGDYVDWVESGTTSNQHYLVANNNGLSGPLRALIADIGFFGGLMDRRRIDGFVYLWYGPGGTVTPLHHDTANILFCQVRGKKRVTLIDPAYSALVRDCVSFYSVIDVERPDPKRFPYFEKLEQRTVTVGPGDALFIPCGWWHFVRGLSTSVSISMTNFSLPNPGGFDDVVPGSE